MSRKCCCRSRRDYGVRGAYEGNSCGGGNGLLILILIALQFKGCRRNRHDDDECNNGVIDNSILFLITLYFLVCHSNRFTLGCGNSFGF